MTDTSINQSGIGNVTIIDEMKRSYLDYAMSVIISRALPDVRDGLKPVHRRIIYSMNENGYEYNKPFRKSARIVGDVMGKYHPHGDAAIYDAMVRMAQDFSMRLPLVQGQGNFGSMDGDKAAAMRYTEARLQKVTSFLVDDIDKETVDFQPNYDETVKEPAVLPAKFPNLLVNGASGIAVGMATNIPPHNLGEVIDACCAYIDNPEITTEQICEIVKGPDFPTGGIILGSRGIREAFFTGKGSIVIRGKCHIEEIRKDRFAIVATEIPYQVNKAAMITKMAELVREKKIEGIADLRDESDRQGVRVVVEIKRDFQPDVVLNQLYKFSPLQSSFGVNMLALSGGRPIQMNLLDIIKAFINFREEVIRRRTIFELDKARARAHILVGLAIAVTNLDPVIKIIKESSNPTVAKDKLMANAWDARDVEPLIKLIDEPEHIVIDGKYSLSETQAKAILDLRLHRLTGLEREKIQSELQVIGEQIKEYLSILSSRERVFDIMRTELTEIRTAFATPRKTEIEDIEFEQDLEALIQREEMVVTVTNTGYIKRVPLSSYRAQKRGGKGKSGMTTKEEDYVSRLFIANTHTPVLFFSSRGIVYKLKVYKLPLGSPQSKGKPFINLLPLQEGETISTIMSLPEDEASCNDMFVMLATSTGTVRRNSLADFVNVMANGKIAMKLDDNDRLINVLTCSEDDDVFITTKNGKCIRFPVKDIRVFVGRNSTGVRAIRLSGDDVVVNMSLLKHIDFDTPKRDEYLKVSSALKRNSSDNETSATSAKETGLLNLLTEEEFNNMAENEEFILSVTSTGYGKRSSSYEYRVTGRGGQGIANIEMSERNKDVVASFPIKDSHQIMLVTDSGKLIRMPVDNIRVAGRKTQGVILFRTSDDENVVSATWIEETEDEDSDNEMPIAVENEDSSNSDEPKDENIIDDESNF
ncbi:MAG: DNA gyrase subunit A [Alphaproteobacteria bacterium]